MFKKTTAFTIPLFPVKWRSCLDFCHRVCCLQIWVVSTHLWGPVWSLRVYTSCVRTTSPCDLPWILSNPLSLLLYSQHRKHFQQEPLFPIQFTLSQPDDPFKMQMEEYFWKRLSRLLPLPDAFELVSSLLGEERGIYEKTLKAWSEPRRAHQMDPCIPKKLHCTELSYRLTGRTCSKPVPPTSTALSYDSFVNFSAREWLISSCTDLRSTSLQLFPVLWISQFKTWK